MNAKHTPGPWFYDEDFQLVETDDGQFLASMKFSQSPAVGAAEANGTLIAAAPDLLEALQELSKSFISKYIDDERSDFEIAMHRERWEAKARAAIAKATGAAA